MVAMLTMLMAGCRHYSRDDKTNGSSEIWAPTNAARNILNHSKDERETESSI